LSQRVAGEGEEATAGIPAGNAGGNVGGGVTLFYVLMTTVAEIEAAIEKLRPDEFAELAAWLDARRADEVEGGDFRKAMDKVFTHHSPLLRKLSQ